MAWRRNLALIVLAVALPSEARTTAACMAAFRTDVGWSREKRVDVDFYTARELYPDAREFPVHVRIWFNRSYPALALVEGASLSVPRFSDGALQRLFPDGRFIYGTDPVERQDWRVRCIVDGEWVDPRLPSVFDPPHAPIPPVEPRRRRLY